MNHSLLILVVHALVHVYNVTCQQNLYVLNQVVFSDELSPNIPNFDAIAADFDAIAADFDAIAADFEIENQEENSFFQYKYQVPILAVLIIIFIILLIVYCKVYCKTTTTKEQQKMEIYTLSSINSESSSDENLKYQEIQNQTSVNPEILGKSTVFTENEKSANIIRPLRMEDQKKLRNPPTYFKDIISRNETVPIQVKTTNSFYI